MTSTPLLPSRWIIPERQREAEQRLMQELKVTSLLAAALVSRGLTDPEEANHFLNPRLEDLHSPKLLPDFDAAAKAILGARERGERIFVHGDYDVDGVTSAALFTRFLGKLGCDVVAHVPHRMKEGYGIHIDIVQAAKETGARLFLTCDCGSGAHAQVEAAREAGMTVVVTDHHLLKETLPNAAAVVNPHRDDSVYPFPELSGVGVVFKLCEGINAELGQRTDQYQRAYLDLVTLGTVADVMPLVGENRILVKYGLQQLQATKKVGLQALMDVTKFDRHEAGAELKAHHIGFQLGPRLNAVGRIDDAATALQLLLATDEMQARELAAELDKVNNARRLEQEQIYKSAEESVISQELDRNLVLMVAGESWHTGIVGIVAGKLVERFNRPAFVLKHDTEKDIVRGSARSVPGFNLGEAIRRVEHLLLSGGGHEMAAGISLRRENLEEVYANFCGYASEFLTFEDLVPTHEVIGAIGMNEVNERSLHDLDRLEPFGCANPRPVLMASNLTVTNIMPTKNPIHPRVELTDETGQKRMAMAFGLGEVFEQIPIGSVIDVVFKAEIEEWQGRKSAKWHVRDVRLTPRHTP
ncbi:MAG: single-stranded-DNA-specific exonuclease RecJ [Fimbriimonadaceae bacterium]|nr:single-stranded-DNA-specific exonuclease RecJ [Fimbriimonadaceae bacterium]